MSAENLYDDVKNKICDMIFKGVYEDGDRIPAERILAEELNVSRVTVRKSLELLEKEKLVVREVGSGTRVSLNNYGSKSNMDMIVLIAPAKNPFFSDFIAHFQEFAGKEDSMILYVEKPKKESIENCLYKLYKKGLQNVVIWLEDLPVDAEKLKRLRALGMNMVFFDTDKGIPYGDCVTLDNELAVEKLYHEFRNRGLHHIGYAGWDRRQVYAIGKREGAFHKLAGKGNIFLSLPWEQRYSCEEYVYEYINQYDGTFPQALICGDEETGLVISNVLTRLKRMDVLVATVDEFPEAKARNMITYVQDLDGSVRQIFECLNEQNILQEKWKAALYKLPGFLHNYSES